LIDLRLSLGGAFFFGGAFADEPAVADAVLEEASEAVFLTGFLLDAVVTGFLLAAVVAAFLFEVFLLPADSSVILFYLYS
jgi:hypothetical protein